MLAEPFRRAYVNFYHSRSEAFICDENASCAPALLKWRSMDMRIKIRHRSPFPKPWKWEIFVGKRLITASNESYASQREAHGAGRDALDRIVLEFALQRGHRR